MKIVVFGGDARQIASSLYLKNKGYDVSIFAIDKKILEVYGAQDLAARELIRSDAVIFPLPFSRDGENINCPFTSTRYDISDVFRTLDKRTRVFCGMASGFHKRMAREYGLELIDYYEREELQIKNAVPTAEGAILTFMNRKEITVFGSECTVCGYGKIGKCLADRLKSFGAHVTVASRSETSVAAAQSFGIDTVSIDEFINGRPYCGDCIFNTVPCNIFNDDFVCGMGQNAMYIELASFPYGMSESCAEKLGERYVAAPSLPGRTAPLSSGKIIAETVCNLL
ncbi:MAG: hypothetical protein IKN38_07100 [Clostridia bacterium]|nr:hypothetical protein [Clostridia bacterium]